MTLQKDSPGLVTQPLLWTAQQEGSCFISQIRESLTASVLRIREGVSTEPLGRSGFLGVTPGWLAGGWAPAPVICQH